MNRFYRIAVFGSLVATISPHPVFAYVGPGGAVSGIGALLALVAAVFFAILGFLWLPLKRLLSKNSPKNFEAENKKREDEGVPR